MTVATFLPIYSSRTWKKQERWEVCGREGWGLVRGEDGSRAQRRVTEWEEGYRAQSVEGVVGERGVGRPLCWGRKRSDRVWPAVYPSVLHAMCTIPLHPCLALCGHLLLDSITFSNLSTWYAQSIVQSVVPMYIWVI